MSTFLLYFFAVVGASVTLLVLFLTCSWFFVRAVTRAALRRKAEQFPALTPLQPQPPTTSI